MYDRFLSLNKHPQKQPVTFVWMSLGLNPPLFDSYSSGWSMQLVKVENQAKTINCVQYVGCFALSWLLTLLKGECTLYWVNVLLTSGSWPLCFLYMLEAAAAFLARQLQWQALSPSASFLPLSHSTFSLSPSSLFPPPYLGIIFFLVHISLPLSCTLCLCLVPIFPLSPPQPSLSVRW